MYKFYITLIFREEETISPTTSREGKLTLKLTANTAIDIRVKDRGVSKGLSLSLHVFLNSNIATIA